ncbi:hypothetical protein [Natranaerobius trueperi]|uniref:hypothetical protein n=1 Tax=Natranaerobius trueperi TaxID=759412 RepID=UPI00117EBCD5|nr:hypothetical protein [Natranaerobius trueperi]
MNIEQKLNDKEHSHLIKEIETSTNILIGAPHHAPKGIKSLPCKEHPDSDENVGYLAQYLANKLNASYIIAVNAKSDYNKILDSEYIQFIKYIKPKIFIEIHGHGGTNAKQDIEISTGSKDKESWSIELSKILKENLQKDDTLNNLSVSGSWNEIYFTAKYTKSIKTGDWIGFHIELPQNLRISKLDAVTLPPEEGYLFLDYLAKTVKQLINTL